MNEAQDFFLRECAAHARSLPVTQAILYLRGLLISCNESSALEGLHAIYDRLVQSDNQLDLIHTGQMKLEFHKKGSKRKGDGK